MTVTMDSDKFNQLLERLAPLIPEDRLIHDDLRTLAYGTDASFYRLIPKLVVRLESEDEVQALLRACGDLGLPLTFRAAGTSLSGQAISDSVLAMLGTGWKGYSIRDNGALITLQPGVIGAHANVYLAPFGRKIGPDPASINSAMIGGIAANNSSGMCCGTAQNSYRTLESMRLVFADGSALDTGDPASRAEFSRTHAPLLADLSSLAARVRQNTALADRIRRKFRMKNTTGYSLNALVDFEDPFEIIQHLMIGSEGTLGFISSITYRTVPEWPHKATALMLFPDMRIACEAVALLKETRVDAVEIMDRASLRSVQGKPGMPEFLAGLDEAAASLLVETRAPQDDLLQDQVSGILRAIGGLSSLRPHQFTAQPAEYAALWNIRKGLFPSVGAMRETGTTVIIEDVAFPVSRLAEAAGDLQRLFLRHHYDDAIIFGHALEGNLHFVFKQDFNPASEVERYRSFMDDVCELVVGTYDGSLKAEHGTGRNVAPYVELEWGSEALEIMREIKRIFDPGQILNPGVILNRDPAAHVTNLKPLPAADPLIDKCIECGFCEVQCPSRDLSLTPRQRIVIFREMSRLSSLRDNPSRLRLLREGFEYQGNQTCATDGLCATSCPVGIDTGRLIKDLRHNQASPAARRVAEFAAGHMGSVTAAVRGALALVSAIHRMAGTRIMSAASAHLRALSGNRLPLWSPALPRSAGRIRNPRHSGMELPGVVYFPTCINRTMGAAPGAADPRPLAEVTISLLEKAGYRVVLPARFDELCCGMAFASKGFKEPGDAKAAELESALRAASDGGSLPILTDMSPCYFRMKECFTPGLRIYEPVRFALEFLVDRLEFRRNPGAVAVHTTCSAEKLGLGPDLKRLAGLCVETVVVPHGVGCCGWAGDRGFTHPELNASALKSLRSAIPAGCSQGYSTSRTCEIGLTIHGGIPYASIYYLVDGCTSAKKSIEQPVHFRPPMP